MSGESFLLSVIALLLILSNPAGVGLTREGAVVAAVLLGCDFVPGGVPGVGREVVLQLLSGWTWRWDALAIMRRWIRDEFAAEESQEECEQCLSDLTTPPHCQSCQDFVREVAASRDSACHGCRCRALDENKRLGKAEATVKKK